MTIFTAFFYQIAHCYRRHALRPNDWAARNSATNFICGAAASKSTSAALQKIGKMGSWTKPLARQLRLMRPYYLLI